jgi:ankyrin repeat protein
MVFVKITLALLVSVCSLRSQDLDVIEWAKKNRWEDIFKAVDKNPDLLSQTDSKTGNSLLHWAILAGNESAVSTLVDNKNLKPIDEMKNKGGYTPLHVASFTDNKEIFLIVLEKAKDLNLKDNAENTALCFAVSSGKSEYVKALLEKGCDPEIPNALSLRPLHLAIQSGRENIVKYLIEIGAGANLRSHGLMGFTPLHFAVMYDRISVCKMLLNRDKTLVTELDDKGNNPLHEAVRSGRKAAVEILLENGANPKQLNIEKMTPLDIAKEQVKKKKDKVYSEILDLLDKN